MFKLTNHQLIESLRSTLCPSCGGVKNAKRTFCGICYFRLNGELRNRLYDGLGNGYLEAVSRAMDALAAHTFWVPSGTIASEPKPDIGPQQSLFGAESGGPREEMGR